MANIRGFQYNFGPLKEQIEAIGTAIGALTGNLNSLVHTMGTATTASSNFHQAANGISSTAMQTPIGMQTQAAASMAGFGQVTYGQRFHELTQAAASGQDIHRMGLSQADADIVRRSREGMAAVADMRARNTPMAPPGQFNNNVHQMAAMQPVVQGLTTQMKAAGWTASEVANHWQSSGPEASRAFSTLDPKGLGSSRDFSYIAKAQSYMGKPELSDIAAADRQRIDNNVAKATERTRQAQEAAADKAREETKRSFNTSFQVGDQALRGNTRAAVTGDNNYRYGLGDIVSAKSNLANNSSQLDSIKAFTDKLKASGDVLDKGLGAELEKTISKFSDLTNQFDRLNNSLQGQQVGSEKYQKTLADLARTSGQLNQTYEDLKDSAKQGGGGGNGGNNGGPTGLQKFQQFNTLAATGLGATIGLVDSFMNTRRTMFENSIGSERGAVTAESQLAQAAFKTRREQVDMSNIDNRLKYRAESILTPTQLADNPLLGMVGRQKALAMSAEEARMAMDLQKKDKQVGLYTGIGKGLLGAAEIGAAVVAGKNGQGALAVMAGAQGVTSIVNAATGVAATYENQYNRIVNGGLPNTTLGSVMGGTKDMAVQNARKSSAELSLSVVQGMEDLQNSAVMSNQDLREGMQGLEDSRLARLRGVALVGRSATRGLDVISGDIEAGRKLGTGRTTENGLGNLANYQNSNIAGISKDSIMYAFQGVESNFNPSAQSATSSAQGLYQILGKHNKKVALEGARKAMNMPKMTMDMMFSNRDAQNAGMSALLDTYDPKALMTAFPGLTAEEAIPLEHLAGRGKSGMAAIANYMANNHQGKTVDGTDMAKYVAKFNKFRSDRGGQTGSDNYFENVDSRSDMASSLGLSIAEFADKRNVASNFVGTSGGDRLISNRETSQLIGMSRSGAGPFESLMSNLQGLNQTRGGQNNFEQLKEIFAAGTAAGFDKSRTAQQFVQTVTGLSQALDISNTNNVSSTLGIGARLASADGRGDEKSLAGAANAAQAYQQSSSASSGFIGARKYSALVSAGVDYAHGLSMYNSMSGQQMVAGMQSINAAQSLEDIKDPQIRALIDQRMGEKGENFKTASAIVAGNLNAGRDAERKATESKNSAFVRGENSWTKLTNLQADPGFAKLSTKEKIRKLQQLGNSAAVQGAPTMGGFANAQGAFTARVQELGILDGQEMAAYEAGLAKDMKAAEDEVKINTVGDVNKNVKSVAATQTGKASKENLAAFFSNKSASYHGVNANTYSRLQNDENFKKSAEGIAAQKKIDAATPEELGFAKGGPRQMDQSEAQSILGKTFDAATAKILGDQIGAALGKSPLNTTLMTLNGVLDQIKLRIK